MDRPFYANNERSKRRPITQWTMEIYASEERSGEDDGQERYIDPNPHPPIKESALENCVLVIAFQVLTWLTYAAGHLITCRIKFSIDQVLRNIRQSGRSPYGVMLICA